MEKTGHYAASEPVFSVRLEDNPQTTKCCKKCNTPKTLAEFDYSKNGKYARRSICRVCWVESGASQSSIYMKDWRNRGDKTKQQIYDRNYYLKNREKKKTRDLLRRHGITKDEHKRLLEASEGKCAICGEKAEILCLDHDHVTGKLRELLCRVCNFGLGAFQENTRFLKSAIEYLEKHRMMTKKGTPETLTKVGGKRVASEHLLKNCCTQILQTLRPGQSRTCPGCGNHVEKVE